MGEFNDMLVAKRQARNQQSANWQRTPAGKAARKRYQSSIKGKAALRRAQRTYRSSLEGKAKARYRDIKRRAKQRGLSFDLTVDWILNKYKGPCELTGVDFVFKTPGSKANRVFNPLSASVDRIDNSLGYTKDNCRVILYCVNAFKGTMSDKQTLKIAEQLVYGLMTSTQPTNE